MKRVLLLILAALLVFGGCNHNQNPSQKQYTATFLTLFDTVTTIVGRGESQEAFEKQAQQIHDELLVYHRLFDIYHDYDGLNNLKTVNDQAGSAPVKVDRKIIELLRDCRDYYELTGGRVNVAMGGVLQLWHEARNDGINDPGSAALPEQVRLEAAAKHTGFDTVIIDEQAGTVFLSDESQRLDVGAIAKGWAVQRVAENAPEGLLISVGGNVCATGPKTEDGTPWVVGINDPQGGSDYLHTLNITGGCVVTSGDYQRYYVVNGQPYHHIIDPDTLYPAGYWSSVTIVCRDSGLADALSTALFLLPRDQGQKLLESCHAEALWVDREGNMFYSPGFEELIRT